MCGRKGRSQKGQMSEFGAAFIVLVCFVLLPLLNMSFVPVRFMMCEGVLNELARRLAHCEKFSEADATMKKEQWWKQTLGKCGVTISKEELKILVSRDGTNDRLVVRRNQKVADEWMPGNNQTPCVYTLLVTADCSISALYQGPFPPVKLKLSGSSQWENLSKDPNSTEYFINE